MDIISLHLNLTTVTYLARKAIEFYGKRKKGYYAIQAFQGHRGRYQSKDRMPVCDFLLVINTN